MLCLLGATGVGKSSLANTLCEKGQLFKTSADIKSETSEVKAVLTQRYIENDGRVKEIMVIDTPGQGDSEGRDKEMVG